MSIPAEKVYPRTGDTQTVYLKAVVANPNIVVGEYTMYNDFVNNPVDFEKNNVLYHYPINQDRLVIGKFCSIACGAKFIFTSANHSMSSLSTYPFPLFFEEWGLLKEEVTSAWDKKGDIVVENDVWIGYEAVILSGVHIGDGAIIGARAVVTKDVEPYTIVGGVPAKAIRKRFDAATIAELQRLQWWNWQREKIQSLLPQLTRGNLDGLQGIVQCGTMEKKQSIRGRKMEKIKLGFDAFIATVGDGDKAFVTELHQVFMDKGCKIEVKEAKSGYVVSYILNKKTVANFVFRKAGLIVRIYANHIKEYMAFLETLPDAMIQTIQESPNCKRLINPNDCNSKCAMGYEFLLRGQRLQKCRNGAFMFLLCGENNPFIKIFLEQELQACSQQ